MELLIMVSACKGGSARSITAVMPYFPYSRQSKKKQHRGAITARMVANLLHIAGVTHVVTIDLHASQMQGFFKCPVDNLIAEPLLARWIRINVHNWKQAVVVSKNPGGTKRVTSLADALKLSFGIVTTDTRRTATTWNESAMFERLNMEGPYETPAVIAAALDTDANITPISTLSYNTRSDVGKSSLRTRRTNGTAETLASPLSKSVRVNSVVEPEVPLQPLRETSAPTDENEGDDEESADEYTDEVESLISACSFMLLT
jgi:ribose-phosphate pyrophosphokinase